MNHISDCVALKSIKTILLYQYNLIWSKYLWTLPSIGFTGQRMQCASINRTLILSDFVGKGKFLGKGERLSVRRQKSGINSFPSSASYHVGTQGNPDKLKVRNWLIDCKSWDFVLDFHLNIADTHLSSRDKTLWKQFPSCCWYQLLNAELLPIICFLLLR